MIEDDIVAAGRVASGAAYLVRSGEIFPFFEKRVDPVSESDCVGVNAMVEVELASIPLQEADCIVAVSRALTPAEETVLKGPALQGEGDLAAKFVSGLSDSVQPTFVLVARIGPKAVYLDEVVE